MYDFESNRRLDKKFELDSPSPTVSPGTNWIFNHLSPTRHALFNQGRLFLPSNRHLLQKFHFNLPSSAKSIPIDEKNFLATSQNNYTSHEPVKIHTLHFDGYHTNDGLLRYSLGNQGAGFTDTVDSGIFSLCEEPHRDHSDPYDIVQILRFEQKNDLNENYDIVEPVTVEYCEPAETYTTRTTGPPSGPLLYRKTRGVCTTVDYEYDLDHLLKSVHQTSVVTCVFEVKNRGLEEIFQAFNDDLLGWLTSNTKKPDEKAVVACCELLWSVPLKFRDYSLETELKNNLGRCLRYNNHAVWDKIDEINENSKKCAVFPGSVIQEQCVSSNGCFIGSYRRFYDGLLPVQHVATGRRHKPVWKLDVENTPGGVPWQMIGAQKDTTVLILNLICLRFGPL